MLRGISDHPFLDPFIGFVQLVLSPSAVVSLRTWPWSSAPERDYYSNVHRRFHPALSYSEDHTGRWALAWDKLILIVSLNSCCCERARVCAHPWRSSQIAVGYSVVRKPKHYRMVFFGCKWSPGELSGSVWISVTECWTRLVRNADLGVFWVCVHCMHMFMWFLVCEITSSEVKLSVFVKSGTGGQNMVFANDFRLKQTGYTFICWT